ncbi:BON domain-containing protein [Streptomyces tritici]|uniref:BON domain-containing protein n=1 Tax=Streptomyces tritici TaxID=2054410 RepID=UPI003AEFA079
MVNDVGMLEGVVSRSDLLKVFLRTDAEIEQDIRRSVLGEPATTVGLDVTVADGVAKIRGPLADRPTVPLVARAVRAVEGVDDVRMDLGAPRAAP